MLPAISLVHDGTQLVISLHGIALTIGVGAGTLLALRRAREPAVVLLAATVVAVVSLAGSHALFALLHGGSAASWNGGLASTGGVVAGLGTAWLVARASRRPAGELLDVIVPAGLLALGIGRVGCFLAGCCFGVPTALPLGVVFPELGPPPRHPLQLYSAAGDLGLLLLVPVRGAPPGTVACRACLGFGLLRAGLEMLRDPGATDALVRGWLTLPQAAALLLAGGAALTAVRLRLQNPSTMPPARRKAEHGG